MNIFDFEANINRTILERGYSYYIEGNVLETFADGENEYVFYIEGSDDYEVLVKISENGDILYSECDCPYDFGPTCKHEVASYFQLVEMLNEGKQNGKRSSKSYEIVTIQEVLEKLSKEELISIIQDITKRDVALQNKLIFKYSNGDPQQELQICGELIDSIVRKFTGREGFINYRDTGAFVRALDEVADKIRKTDNALLALDIALLLLSEAMEAFQYADDSNGEIGLLVDNTLELIDEIASSPTEQDPQRSEMFERLLGYSDREVFDGWEDYRIELLNICIEFADDEILRKQLSQKLEAILEEQSSDRYAHYIKENILQLLFKLTEQYGTEEEAEQFIHEHIQFSSFREQMLNKYLAEKNYEKVIELAKEGEKQDTQYPGLIFKWQQFRYSAYEYLAQKEEQLNLARELFLSGHFEYYQVLKKLSTEDMGLFYGDLKRELKEVEGRRSRGIFLKLIEEENDLEEIMEFVRDNPSYVEDYAERLVGLFEHEILKIYEDFIRSQARSSNNRRQYQEVCEKIIEFKNIAGRKKQVELINDLISIYKKRRAFVDELGKI